MPMILQTVQKDLVGKNIYIYIYIKYFGFNCNKSTSDNNTAKYEMLSTLKYKSDNSGKPHTHIHIKALLVTSEEVGL